MKVKSMLTTLCYIEKGDSYLMLHRIKKESDVNKDKWIGVGGHFEEDESPEYMCLYTADGYEGTLCACNEGILEWVQKKEVLNLNLWEGDKIFFKLLEENHPFFSLKLMYQGDTLREAVLDGERIR